MNMESKCTIRSIDGDECNNAGEPRNSGTLTFPPVCDEHWIQHRVESRNYHWGATLSILNDKNQLVHSKGFTYVIRRKDGTIKIGYAGPLVKEYKNGTGVGGHLLNRWKKFSKEDGAFITPLAVVDGGETQEGLFHRQWRDYRLPGNGERFSPAPELLEWASTLGIAEGARSQVDAFNDMKMQDFLKGF